MNTGRRVSQISSSVKQSAMFQTTTAKKFIFILLFKECNKELRAKQDIHANQSFIFYMNSKCFDLTLNHPQYQ